MLIGKQICRDPLPTRLTGKKIVSFMGFRYRFPSHLLDTKTFIIHKEIQKLMI